MVVTDAGVITASGGDVCPATVTPTIEESERIAQTAKAIPAVAEARHPVICRFCPAAICCFIARHLGRGTFTSPAASANVSSIRSPSQRYSAAALRHCAHQCRCSATSAPTAASSPLVSIQANPVSCRCNSLVISTPPPPGVRRLPHAPFPHRPRRANAPYRAPPAPAPHPANSPIVRQSPSMKAPHSSAEPVRRARRR
jgi:hypothetical protein